MRLPMKPAVIKEEGIKAFYTYNSANADTSYFCYSSVAEIIKCVSYGTNGILFDDENITINKTGSHNVSITFKKVGYLVNGITTSAQTAPVVMAQGTYSYTLAYTHSFVIYFK